jgi:hypothetical protein
MSDVQGTEEHFDIASLLDAGDLVDVRLLAFNGALNNEKDESLEDDAVETDVQVHVVNKTGVLQVTMDMNIKSSEATYFVRGATQFHYSDSRTVPKDVARDFAERVGVMAIYPYIREALQSFSSRLNQPPVTLPLLRSGEVTLDQNADTADEAAQSDS